MSMPPRPLRIAIVVTHLLGIGHLARAAALARALASRGHTVMLLSGGQPAPLLRADGVELIQLPPLHVLGTAFSELRQDDGALLRPETAKARIDMAIAALDRLKPDVLVTELFPFGRRALGDEFRAILAAACALEPRPLILSSVRDILACPDKQTKIDAAHALLRQYYDGVLVHSDAAVAPLQASWPIAADLIPHLHYTGYVDDDAPGLGARDSTAPSERDGIVVSGGGSAAALPLLRAALAAARLDERADRQHRTWRLLVGHKIPAQTMAELQADAPANAIVERARPDFRDLLRRCAVSVSQFGYNTALDILATQTPAVVVPFAEGGETEQSQRAALFAARGLVAVVAPERLGPERLLAAVNAAPARSSAVNSGIAVDGAGRSAQIIEQLVASRAGSLTAEPSLPAAAFMPAAAPLVAELCAALRPVDEALHRAGDNGQHIDFWWRDDDAIAPTPQLERLLALANAHESPLAIAAIPADATLELAQRLADEALASVLVHGLTHENLAPEGAKKGEFSHGDPAQLAARAARGLNIIARLFGTRSVPVFTPPWNRISAGLLPLLPDAGFAGVSTFKERTTPFAAPGLVQVNAHIDPVAWRTDRSLLQPEKLAADLCEAIHRRADATDATLLGPIGLLTHHLIHDGRVDAFTACLLTLIASHRTASWVAIGDAIGQMRTPTPATP